MYDSVMKLLTSLQSCGYVTPAQSTASGVLTKMVVSLLQCLLNQQHHMGFMGVVTLETHKKIFAEVTACID